METFTETKGLIENPHFRAQREKCLCSLSDDMIDAPILEIIRGFNKLPYCFTLQCCYGHFVYNDQKDPYNIEALPAVNNIHRVTYKIAYIVFCIENSICGKGLLESLKDVTAIDPENVQFFCAEWFWERQINSYALQVAPNRFKQCDKEILDYKEALYIEKVRNKFFIQLDKLLNKELLCFGKKIS